MLVKKGGISRNIDEKRLHEYTAKGYVPAGKDAEQKEPAGKDVKQTEPKNPAGKDAEKKRPAGKDAEKK